jgi:hypothetical protein
VAAKFGAKQAVQFLDEMIAALRNRAQTAIDEWRRCLKNARINAPYPEKSWIARFVLGGENMKIVGHTMGTPELSLLEAIDLFADMGLDSVEVVVQDGYKSGFSHVAGKEVIEDVKKAAERRGLENCLKSLVEETA